MQNYKKILTWQSISHELTLLDFFCGANGMNRMRMATTDYCFCDNFALFNIILAPYLITRTS